MVTRLEKNKIIQNKIQKEKNINFSKNMLKITALLTLIFITIFLLIRFFGTNFIKVHEYLIEDKLIPSSFSGIKILHFTDLLYGSTINKNDLIYLNKQFKKIKPDIVVFTGNIISNEYNLKKEDIAFLKNFFKEIPSSIGKYSIKGNLDSSTYDLIMNEANFIQLDNNYELLYYKENIPITLIGLNSNNLDLTKIDIKEINNYYKISLISNYDKYDKTLKSNLILAGHNLNGELYLPFYGGILGNNKYNGKYYHENNSDIYISNGLGSHHKIRMFNHPSINVYRLLKK